MSFNIDEIQVYKGQLLVCDDEIIPEALGVGEEKITGSAFIQGPVQIGNPSTFHEVLATVMIGPDNNDESSACLLYTSPSPRDRTRSRMPSSA